MIRWSPEVQNIFYRGNKRQLVPSSRAKLEHFFNCAATMMTRQLQNLALDSTADYIDLLIQPPVNSSLYLYHLSCEVADKQEGSSTCSGETDPLLEELNQ